MWMVCVQTLNLKLEDRRKRTPAPHTGIRIPGAALWAESMGVLQAARRSRLKGKRYGAALKFALVTHLEGPFPRNSRTWAAPTLSQHPILTPIWACPPQQPPPSLRQHIFSSPLSGKSPSGLLCPRSPADTVISHNKLIFSPYLHSCTVNVKTKNLKADSMTKPLELLQCSVQTLKIGHQHPPG